MASITQKMRYHLSLIHLVLLKLLLNTKLTGSIFTSGCAALTTLLSPSATVPEDLTTTLNSTLRMKSNPLPICADAIRMPVMLFSV